MAACHSRLRRLPLQPPRRPTAHGSAQCSPGRSQEQQQLRRSSYRSEVNAAAPMTTASGSSAQLFMPSFSRGQTMLMSGHSAAHAVRQDHINQLSLNDACMRAYQRLLVRRSRDGWRKPRPSLRMRPMTTTQRSPSTFEQRRLLTPCSRSYCTTEHDVDASAVGSEPAPPVFRTSFEVPVHASALVTPDRSPANASAEVRCCSGGYGNRIRTVSLGIVWITPRCRRSRPSRVPHAAWSDLVQPGLMAR
jgi:hypothetical protein